MNAAAERPPQSAAESAISRIKGEHRALACVLGGIQVWVARCREPGAIPDLELLDSMLRYVENVPDRLHHPKEDAVLFPTVAIRAPDGATLVRELERDHARGAPMLAALRHAFRVFRDGGQNALNQLGTAADEFTDFYLYHMRREEEQLLPLAVVALAQADWERVDSAFSNNADPLFNAELSAEYRKLYQHITDLTPGSLKSLLESGAIEARQDEPAKTARTRARLVELCCYATGQVKRAR